MRPEIKKRLDALLLDPNSLGNLLECSELYQGSECIGVARQLHDSQRYSLCRRFIEAVLGRGVQLNLETAVTLRHIRADTLHEEANFKGAIAEYDEIIRLQRSDVAFANRALAHWELGNYRSALADYSAALELNPANAMALRGAGEMLIKLDDPRGALHRLRKATEVNPEYAAAFTALGIAYYNCEEWLNSYRALKRALELNPDDKIAKKGVDKIETHFGLRVKPTEDE